jgi:hypothetical protein
VSLVCSRLQAIFSPKLPCPSSFGKRKKITLPFVFRKGGKKEITLPFESETSQACYVNPSREYFPAAFACIISRTFY